MLHKTLGIVLRCTSYAESSIVAHIFTEKFGLESYLIRGAKKPKSLFKNILQPLQLLDMVVYRKLPNQLQYVSDLKPVLGPQKAAHSIAKGPLVLFLDEVLYKALKNQAAADELLFKYLSHAIELFGQLDEGLLNFHLVFLLHLTKFLGFYPDLRDSSLPFFDLKEGSYTGVMPSHTYVLRQPYTNLWALLLHSSFETLPDIKLSPHDQKFLLTKILDYYWLHISGFGAIHAHKLIEELLT